MRIQRMMYAVLLSGCAAVSADGAIIGWASPTGGSLNSGLLWAGGVVPTLTDTALFDLGGSYTITTSATLSMNQMQIGTDTITANFGTLGLVLDLIDTLANPAIAMGLVSGDVAQLTITGGTVDGEQASIGFVAGSQGTVDVSGTGTKFFVNTNVAIGYAGAGFMNVSGSAFGDLGLTTLGHLATGAGTVTADGTGTRWGNAFGLRVGNSGMGQFTLTNGAIATGPTVWFGYEATGNGTGVINGLGSSLVSGSWIRVGRFGSGMLTIENGGRAETIIASLGFGSGSDGTMIVTGQNSTLLAQSKFDVGVVGTGTLEIRNFGTANVQSMTIGAQGGNGSVLVDGAFLFSTLAVDVGIDQSSTGMLTMNNGVLSLPDLNIGSTGTFTGFGGMTGNLTSLGVVSPGLPIGTITMQGSLTLPAGIFAGSLRMGIDATGSDQLVANLASTVGGILVLELENGFVPAAGSTYTIVQCLAGLGGTFDAFVKPPLLSGIDFTLEYTGTSVLVHVVSTGPIGDVTGDGVVDGADLGQLLGAWGSTTNPVMDLNNNGIVDGADLGLLLGSWT